MAGFRVTIDYTLQLFSPIYVLKQIAFIFISSFAAAISKQQLIVSSFSKVEKSGIVAL